MQKVNRRTNVANKDIFKGSVWIDEISGEGRGGTRGGYGPPHLFEFFSILLVINIISSFYT
jgi:hypothetical protein